MGKVSLKNVTKKFDRVIAVNNVSLEINEGEFVVLLGPSGCGKTTILRLIAGLEEATEGEITIGDRIVNDLPPKERNIAMVFQSYALYPHMNVFDNIAFSLKLKKVAKAEIDKRVKETAKMLQIDTLLYRKPRQLSGGQRQRVALARAIIRNPVVYLMDEPLSNLDAKLRVQTRAELASLHRRLGTTTVYVTHDQVEAMTLGQKVAVINNGNLEQFDSPDNVYRYPRTKFVASFIGTPPMNFIPASLISIDGEIKLSILDNMFSVTQFFPEHHFQLSSINKGVVFGIRPEDLTEEAYADKKSQILFLQLPLVFKEDLGAEANLYFNTGLDNPLIVKTNAGSNVSVDYMVNIYINPSKIHIFDLESGINLIY